MHPISQTLILLSTKGYKIIVQGEKMKIIWKLILVITLILLVIVIWVFKGVFNVFSDFETPIWTLIGVVIGFLLSYLYSYFEQRRRYLSRTRDATERVKKSMHMVNSKKAIERLSDLIPQFKEKEQLKILSEIRLESSMNPNADELTKVIIEEFRWICILYEVESNNGYNLIKRSRKDKKKVKEIQNVLWDIMTNIVEYRQNEELLSNSFDLLNILNKYSIKQRYVEAIGFSIELFKSIGTLSVGIDYAVDGYKLLNFKCGINESIQQLKDLKVYLVGSQFKNTRISQFNHDIDRSIDIIKNIQMKLISLIF